MKDIDDALVRMRERLFVLVCDLFGDFEDWRLFDRRFRLYGEREMALEAAYYLPKEAGGMGANDRDPNVVEVWVQRMFYPADGGFFDPSRLLPGALWWSCRIVVDRCGDLGYLREFRRDGVGYWLEEDGWHLGGRDVLAVLEAGQGIFEREEFGAVTEGVLLELVAGIEAGNELEGALCCPAGGFLSP